MLHNICFDGCSIESCIPDACLFQPNSFLPWLNINELMGFGLVAQTRLHSSARSCENCGGVRERVSVRFVFSYLMEDQLMQKAWDAVLRCFFSPQKRCYGDKYLAQSILQSNNEVTQSCCEKAVICTVPFYHLARHHHWIRPLLLKRNFKARVLTAGEKLYSWCHVGLSGFPKCPIFCQC